MKTRTESMEGKQMSRKNIFEVLDEKISISSQINKIEALLSEASIDGSTPEDIVDENCMRDWKAKGRFISCQEGNPWRRCIWQ